ncbi:hypothetical protein U3516DRAFT_756411 [Neocallimastix sp. 'constans']
MQICRRRNFKKINISKIKKENLKEYIKFKNKNITDEDIKNNNTTKMLDETIQKFKNKNITDEDIKNNNTTKINYKHIIINEGMKNSMKIKLQSNSSITMNNNNPEKYISFTMNYDSYIEPESQVGYINENKIILKDELYILLFKRKVGMTLATTGIDVANLTKSSIKSPYLENQKLSSVELHDKELAMSLSNNTPSFINYNNQTVKNLRTGINIITPKEIF